MAATAIVPLCRCGCNKPCRPKLRGHGYSKYASDHCRTRSAGRTYTKSMTKVKRANAPETSTPGAMTTEEFSEEAKLLLDSVILPPVPDHIRAVRAEEMQFNSPMHGVACFSDFHLGGVVDPRVTGGIGGYNMEIARRRLVLWRNTVLRFTQIQQMTTKVPVLHVLALGDDFEGNGHMFGSQALQMETSIYFQEVEFVKLLSDTLVSLLERYEKIHVYKVFGNHGRIDARAKDNFDPDNIELMAWNHIADRCELAAPKKFTFDISESFFQVIDILGFSFLIRHGDGMNLRSTYTGVLDSKLAFNSIINEVTNYLILGHHHTATDDEAEIAGEIISNGCFVGPSLFALKMKRPRANRPSQEMLFVHPKRGITARNRIHLATAQEVQNVEKVKRW